MSRGAVVAAAWVALGAGCGVEPRTPLPCDVQQVLSDNCWLCHGDELMFGAFVHLRTWEDVQGASLDMPGRRVWEVMGIRINSEDEPMPPRGVGELSAQDRAVLDAWIAMEAPPAPPGESCTIP